MLLPPLLHFLPIAVGPTEELLEHFFAIELVLKNEGCLSRFININKRISVKCSFAIHPNPSQ